MRLSRSDGQANSEEEWACGQWQSGQQMKFIF